MFSSFSHGSFRTLRTVVLPLSLVAASPVLFADAAAGRPCDIPYPMPSAPLPESNAVPTVPATVTERNRARYEAEKANTHEGYNGVNAAAFAVYGTGMLRSTSSGLRADSRYHGTSYGMSAGYDRVVSLDEAGALTLGVGVGYSEGLDRGEIYGTPYSDTMRNLLFGASVNQVIFLDRDTSLNFGLRACAGVEQEEYRDANVSGSYDGSHQSSLWAIGFGLGLSHRVADSTLLFVGYDFYKVGDTTHRFTSDTGTELALHRRQRSAQQLSIGLAFLW